MTVRFFSFIKKCIIDLDKEIHIKAYPVLFLVGLIRYSGHQPLKDKGGALCVFDIKTGVFDPREVSSDFIDDQAHVSAVYNLFYGEGGDLDGLENIVFNILLSYCDYHLPGYESKQSVEIIRETLYD